jgi:hypothetical protein
LERVSGGLVTVIITLEDGDRDITGIEGHGTFFYEVNGSVWFCDITGESDIKFGSNSTDSFFAFEYGVNRRACCLVCNGTSFESGIEEIETSLIVSCVFWITSDIITCCEFFGTDSIGRWIDDEGLRRCTVGSDTGLCLAETTRTISIPYSYGTLDGSIDGSELEGVGLEGESSE